MVKKGLFSTIGHRFYTYLNLNLVNASTPVSLHHPSFRYPEPYCSALSLASPTGKTVDASLITVHFSGLLIWLAGDASGVRDTGEEAPEGSALEGPVPRNSLLLASISSDDSGMGLIQAATMSKALSAVVTLKKDKAILQRRAQVGRPKFYPKVLPQWD